MEDIKDILINKGFKLGNSVIYDNIECLIATNEKIYISILKDIKNNTYLIESGLNFYNLEEVINNVPDDRIEIILDNILSKYT